MSWRWHRETTGFQPEGHMGWGMRWLQTRRRGAEAAPVVLLLYSEGKAMRPASRTAFDLILSLSKDRRTIARPETGRGEDGGWGCSSAALQAR